MKSNISDSALLTELGARLQRHRLNMNMTQAALAKEAGLSQRTINRLEQGHSTTVSNLIRLLRSLGLLENLDALVPEPAISPIQQMKLRGKSRKRASSKREKEGEVWSWEEGE